MRVTNEVTEGGLKEIGRRWRGAKEAIAAAAARAEAGRGERERTERRHFHHPISAVAEDGGRAEAEAEEAGRGARDCSTAAAVKRGERSGACH